MVKYSVVGRIIEPLTSRCSKFRFKPLGSEVVEKRLQFICDQEKLSCSPEVKGGLVVNMHFVIITL